MNIAERIVRRIELASKSEFAYFVDDLRPGELIDIEYSSPAAYKALSTLFNQKFKRYITNKPASGLDYYIVIGKDSTEIRVTKPSAYKGILKEVRAVLGTIGKVHTSIETWMNDPASKPDDKSGINRQSVIDRLKKAGPKPAPRKVKPVRKLTDAQMQKKVIWDLVN